MNPGTQVASAPVPEATNKPARTSGWPRVAALLAWARRERRWLLALGVFALLSVIELYTVQALTLAPNYQGGPSFMFWSPKIRLVLDVCFVCTWTLLLGRVGLALFACGAAALNLLLLTYFRYFYRPLSILAIATNWQEGLSVSEFGLDLVNTSTVAILGAVLIAKLAALAVAGPHRLRWRMRLSASGALAGAFCVLFLIAGFWDPLRYIVGRRNVGRLGIIRGYMGPWLAELYYLGDDRLLEAAIERRSVRCDALSPVEASIPIHDRLVIVQAESLDFNILGHRENGREVTPFLNRLRGEAMFYRARAFHFIGSSDADFTALAGVPASPTVSVYNLPGYPFENTLPQLLHAHGYQSYALHGNHGAFYNRYTAFSKMGFDEILFREQLERKYGLPADRIGVRDRDVLRTGSQLLRESGGKTFEFIITLTSHTPYTFLGPQDDDLFPQPANSAQLYFNSIHYLDDCLREFLISLPRHTTVLIYADHCTEVSSDGFSPAREGTAEYVPCFIYDTDRNLAELQQTRDESISQNGSLNLLDVITYLRHQVEQDADSQPAPHDSSPPADRSTPGAADSSSDHFIDEYLFPPTVRG